MIYVNYGNDGCNCSGDSGCSVVHDDWLYRVLDTVMISGDDVCCSVVFGTLVVVFVFSVMWSELLMASAVSSPLWSSVYKCLISSNF